MKPILITLLLFSTVCFSQKQYEFDYLIEYELALYKEDSIKKKHHPIREKDETIKRYYLTNSKKNNYLAIVTELDSLNYNIIFKDEDGIYSNAHFLKSDLDIAEYINIECQYVRRYRNPYKYQINNYAFNILNDTLINGKTYSMYKLGLIKPKKAKRKKIGTNYYIIDKKTNFHLPIFNFSTAYEEWKDNKNLPSGIYFEKYYIDYLGNITSREKLVNFWKIDKKIIIEEECDYTNKEF